MFRTSSTYPLRQTSTRSWLWTAPVSRWLLTCSCSALGTVTWHRWVSPEMSGWYRGRKGGRKQGSGCLLTCLLICLYFDLILLIWILTCWYSKCIIYYLIIFWLDESSYKCGHYLHHKLILQENAAQPGIVVANLFSSSCDLKLQQQGRNVLQSRDRK